MYAGKIALYHSLFTGCLAAALLCLAAALILFFALDIREAWMYLSGSRKRRAVRAAEEAFLKSAKEVRVTG